MNSFFIELNSIDQVIIRNILHLATLPPLRPHQDFTLVALHPITTPSCQNEDLLSSQKLYSPQNGSKFDIVNLLSKGPGRKGNPLLRDKDLSLFYSYSYIVCRFQSMGKIQENH